MIYRYTINFQKVIERTLHQYEYLYHKIHVSHNSYLIQKITATIRPQQIGARLVPS